MSSEDIYYRVNYAKRVLELLSSLEARAVAVGRGSEYASALDTINAWLRADPTSLGEAKRDYVSLRVTEYAGGYGLAITYSVHWDHPLVFVLKPLRIMRWAGF
jgi:hypothetical protein